MHFRLSSPAASHGRLVAALAIICVMGLFAATPASAQKVESPLELIYAPDTMLVAGKLAEINPAGRIVIQKKEVIAGKDKPPAKIDARVRKDVFPSLKIGDAYIVAYSMYRRDPRKAVGLVANPDGAIVLDNPGIEPALFRDTPAVRAILKTGKSEHGRESRKLVDLLVGALDSPDPQLRNFAAGEFAYESELVERLNEADRAAIEKFVRNVKNASAPRALLLEACARQPKALGDWWKSAALEIVTTTPVDGYADKASDPVGLVLTALEVLDRYAVKVAPESLKRWVRNPNPPLVERVLVMLRREAPEQERPAIETALADPKLPETTRKFLNDHLRRLDRMNERKAARKEGSG
jgi:hypothetical protein